MDYFDKPLWTYRAVFTQTNVGGGNIIITIAAVERTVFLYGTIGPDDYAADRTVAGIITDGTNTIASILFTSPIDNERIPMWNNDAVATSVNKQTVDFDQKIILGTGQVLQYNISTPIQNETVTIVINAFITKTAPTVSSAGSIGTVTDAVTYDKVI